MRVDADATIFTEFTVIPFAIWVIVRQATNEAQPGAVPSRSTHSQILLRAKIH